MQLEEPNRLTQRDRECGTSHLHSLFRLVAVVRDQGADSVRWRQRLVTGLAQCFAIRLVMFFEFQIVDVESPCKLLSVTAGTSAGNVLDQPLDHYFGFVEDMASCGVMIGSSVKITEHKPLVVFDQNLSLSTAKSLAKFCDLAKFERLRCSGVILARSFQEIDRFFLVAIAQKPRDKPLPSSCRSLLVAALQHVSQLCGSVLADLHVPSASAMPKRRRDVLQGYWRVNQMKKSQMD